MDHADHVRLLRDGVPRTAGTWADLGAGAGAFTLALADLLPPGSLIYAIDKDTAALRDLEDYLRLRTWKDDDEEKEERKQLLDHARTLRRRAASLN